MRIINVSPVLQHYFLSIITKKHFTPKYSTKDPLMYYREEESTEPRTTHKKAKITVNPALINTSLFQEDLSSRSSSKSTPVKTSLLVSNETIIHHVVTSIVVTFSFTISTTPIYSLRPSKMHQMSEIRNVSTDI